MKNCKPQKNMPTTRNGLMTDYVNDLYVGLKRMNKKY